MKRVVRKTNVAVFPLHLITVCLIVEFLGWKAFGLTIEDNIKSPGFSSLLDLQNHYLQSAANTQVNSNWPQWTISTSPQGPPKQFRRGFLEHDRHGSEDSSQSGHLNVLNGKYVRHLISRYKARKEKSPPHSSDAHDLVITQKDTLGPTVQFWSKRETKAQAIPKNADKKATNKTKRLEKITLMDDALKNLQPDISCTKKMGLCAKNPLKNLDCILHCHLSTRALANPTTKFLFRLLKIYTSYPKMLCPTFGSIYNEIPSILKQAKQENSLSGFLTGVGILDQTAVSVEFIENSPSSLFNNLIKFAQGEDFEIVKSVLNAAETAAALQQSETSQFPSVYGNPLCKLTPKEGWFVSMIDAMVKHPSLTDIFLRGYWILTRSLGVGLLYPLDGIFASMVQSIKMMTGVDCSLIAYAEQGKPFKCRKPAPIEEIFKSYAESAQENDADNAQSGMVCGAHQVEIPDWIKDKEGMQTRSGNENLNATSSQHEQKSLGSLYADLNAFPNPDEMMY